MKFNKRKAASYFRQNFLIKKSTNGWYRFSDPFDNHTDNSMAVNFGAGLVKGFRTGYTNTIQKFIEDYEKLGNGLDVLKLVESYNERDYEEITEKVHKVPDDYVAEWPEAFIPFDVPHRMVVRYVRSIGLNYDELADKSFGYCLEGRYKNRIIIPVFIDGYLKYFQGRGFRNYVFPKYLFPSKEEVLIGKSQLFYNQDALMRHRKIYLAEGWACAETMGNAVASFGWKYSLTQKTLLSQALKHLDELVVIPDKGFYRQQVNQMLRFSETGKVKVLNLDNEELKDANELGADIIHEIEDNTHYLSLLDAL